MRTPSRVIILLVALATSFAVIQAGQDNAATSQPTGQRVSPATRFASCIVRITLDPAIMPLDPATLQGLLHSSGVAGAAVREALQRDSIDTSWEELIEMEWLNDFSPRPSPVAGAFEQNDGPPEEIARIYEQRAAEEENAMYDRQIMEEMRKYYGAEYLQQMGVAESGAAGQRGGRAGGFVRPGGRSLASLRENSPAPVPPWQATLGGSPSATIRLSVHLPDDMPPAADKFLEAVINKLRISLSDAYQAYLSDLDDQLRVLQNRRNGAVENLQGGRDPAAVRIREQLDRVVDLSALFAETPFAEAIQMLKNSVEPPLNIVVLWRDLLESEGIEPSTPINIDGMPHVRLRTILDLLVKGLQGFGTELMWRIRDDVIVIATPGGLGESGDSAGQPAVELDIRVLADQRNNLASQLQNLELGLAGQEARRMAIANQIHETEKRTVEQLADDGVTRELAHLVQSAEENVARIRQMIEAGQIPASGSAEATERLTRARIELAKRREELSRQVGGGQLEQLTAEMSRMAIDRAEKEAQRDILRKQLGEVQRQLAQASTFDPETARMRVEREGLNILSRRIAELQTRMANLQPPMVTVIGAN